MESPNPPSLARNLVFNLGARGIAIALAFVSTPVVFHRLGPEGYGVFALALTIGGLFNLLDLGLTPAIIMSLSRSWERRAHREMQEALSTAFTLFIGIGVVGGVVLALLVPWIVAVLLHVPPQARADARLALWLSALAFALNMWLAVFNAVPIALERYDLVAARLVFLSLVNTVVTIVYALFGGTLAGLMIINVLTTIGGLTLFYAISRSLLSSIHFRPGFSPASFRQLARFSAFKFAGTLGGILSFRFDQFAIGALINVSAVGYYAIPANAAARIFSLLIELVAPLFPRASKLSGSLATIRVLFLQGTRIAFLLSTLTLSIIFVFADLLLQYWIHGAHGVLVARESTAALRWLAIAFMIQSVAAVPAVFSEALGKPEINNSFAVAGAIIHVPLVLLLVPRLGITGAAVALCLNSATQTVAFVIVASRKLADVSVWELLRSSITRPLVAACLASALGFVLRGMVHGLFSLGLAAVCMALAYLVFALGVTAITRDDLRYARRVSRMLPARLQGARP
jgi:O-antigen/teichoic acid export membrane protein